MEISAKLLARVKICHQYSILENACHKGYQMNETW